jgi:hypothetical protein
MNICKPLRTIHETWFLEAGRHAYSPATKDLTADLLRKHLSIPHGLQSLVSHITPGLVPRNNAAGFVGPLVAAIYDEAVLITLFDVTLGVHKIFRIAQVNRIMTLPDFCVPIYLDCAMRCQGERVGVSKCCCSYGNRESSGTETYTDGVCTHASCCRRSDKCRCSACTLRLRFV